MPGVIGELGAKVANAGVLNQLEQRVQRIRIHLDLRHAPVSIAEGSDQPVREARQRRPRERVVVENVEHDDARVAGELDETSDQRQSRGLRNVLQHDDGMNEVEGAVYR